MSSDNNVTAAETALSSSDLVVSQCSVVNLSPPSQAVPSQAKSDQCELIVHTNVLSSE